jgi:hypothetical protein
MSASPDQVPQRSRSLGRIYAGAGFLAALLGMAGYAVQICAFKILTTPWYMPVLASVGVGFMVVALARRRGFWRFVGLGVLVLLAAAEWAVLLSLSRLPPYTGPLAVGKPFPDFTTTLADGSSFGRKDLEGQKDTVMVFFRGRW